MVKNKSNSQLLLEQMREREHPNCVFCNPLNGFGLGLTFQVDAKGEVTTDFDCSEIYQGYNGILHGGIISLLLDGAMTNCLFAKQIKAVTGELTVRFRHPVCTDCPATVVARIVKSAVPIYYLEAAISQQGKVCAKARCKFMECVAGDIFRP